jgi:hypothetical protein
VGASGFSLTLENLQGLCERQGLVFKTNEETGQIAVLYRLLDEDAPLYLIPYPHRGMVSFVLPLPFRVPAPRIPHLGEATTRLNSASTMGTWVLDIETGDLQFRVTLPAQGAAYDDDGLLFVTRIVMSAVEVAAGGLQEIAFADKTSHDIWPADTGVPAA